MTTKYILSIDGGGIRGLIPAIVLTHIEQKVGRPISSLFDMVAGTSTGGILALGLSTPDPQTGQPAFDASTLVNLYAARGKEVFPKSLWYQIKSLGGLRDASYSVTGLENLLNDYFGPIRLNDMLNDVLVTGYDIEGRQPVFFKSHKARCEEERNFYVKEVARATSAAPTYFKPATVTSASEHTSYIVDGGVFANNPAGCALAEARKIYPDAQNFVLLSLGTGEVSCPIPYNKAMKWGKFHWLRPVLDIMFDGVSDTVDYQLHQNFSGTQDIGQYYRFQVQLDKGQDQMDDASPKMLRALRAKAEQLIVDQEGPLETICDVLRARPQKAPQKAGS